MGGRVSETEAVDVFDHNNRSERTTQNKMSEQTGQRLEGDGQPSSVTLTPPGDPLPTPRAPLTSPWTPRDILLAALFLSVMSFVGVAVRVLLADEFKANFLGSFLMGLFQTASLKTAFPYSHMGLTVGLCGSLTTFSLWTYSAVKAYDQSFLNFLGEIIVGLTTPFMFFFVGRDLGMWLPPVPSRVATFFCDVLILLIGVCFQILLMSVLPYEDIFTCCLGPFGAGLRYMLGVNFNPIHPKYQIGTLLANVLGVCIVGALESHPGRWSKNVMTGFCGSLSTVSSWVNDTIKDYQQSKAWGYFYCISSVVVCVTIAEVALMLGKRMNEQ